MAIINTPSSNSKDELSGILLMIAAADAVVSLIQQLGNLFALNLLSAPGVQGFVNIAIRSCLCCASTKHELAPYSWDIPLDAYLILRNT